MSELFNEINEELKRENAAALLKKYGKTIAVFCFLILLATAIYTAQKSYNRTQIEKASTDYFNAMNQANSGSPQGAVTLAGLSATAPHPVKDMAALRAGAYFLQHNKKSEALDLYAKIAGDSGADQAFRNLATIILAKNTVGNPDEEKKYDIKNRLQLITAPESTFRAFTYEMLALLDIADHKNDEAHRNLMFITTDTGPNSVEWSKKRAEELLSLDKYEQ